MSKHFTARLPDGTERFAADFSNKRAQVFYDLTKLVEQYVDVPSGLSDDDGTGEYYIDAEQFTAFFERFWDVGWLGEQRGGFLNNWASHAAGMIENITLTPRVWMDRSGIVLEIQRYKRLMRDVREVNLMPEVSKIELVPSSYRQRPILDIVIDGKPLAEHLCPVGKPLGQISPFGWLGEWGRTLDAAAAASLLLKADAELESGRRQLLVCSECGDIGCGAVTAEILKEDGLFIWRRFGFENDNVCPIDYSSFNHLPQLAFYKHEYSALFRYFLA